MSISLKTKSSSELRGLLKHYGCMEDFEVWGEFSESYYSRVDYLEGTNYKMLPVSQELKNNLPLLRQKLRLYNEYPKLQKECPINLYS